jgi:hypothetical protein
MTEEISNFDLYQILLDIKEDVGGLKASSALQLESTRNHSSRITELEVKGDQQRGAAKVWALVGASLAGIIGSAAGWIFERHTH